MSEDLKTNPEISETTQRRFFDFAKARALTELGTQDYVGEAKVDSKGAGQIVPVSSIHYEYMGGAEEYGGEYSAIYFINNVEREDIQVYAISMSTGDGGGAWHSVGEARSSPLTDENIVINSLDALEELEQQGLVFPG